MSIFQFDGGIKVSFLQRTRGPQKKPLPSMTPVEATHSSGLAHQTSPGWRSHCWTPPSRNALRLSPRFHSRCACLPAAGSGPGGNARARSAQFHKLTKGGLYQCDAQMEGREGGEPARQTRYFLPISRPQLVLSRPELSRGVSDTARYLFGWK